MASRKATERKDPEFGNIDFASVFTLKNPDPDKKYIWVFNGTPADGHGLDYYENVEGWSVEMWTEDGVKPNGIRRKENAQEIVVRDHTLMSIDKAIWEARRRAGQARADAVEKQIIRRRGQFDPMRGIGNLHGRSGEQFMSLGGNVSPLIHEIGDV